MGHAGNELPFHEHDPISIMDAEADEARARRDESDAEDRARLLRAARRRAAEEER